MKVGCEGTSCEVERRRPPQLFTLRSVAHSCALRAENSRPLCGARTCAHIVPRLPCHRTDFLHIGDFISLQFNSDASGTEMAGYVGSQGLSNTECYAEMASKEDMRISRSVATESVFMIRNQMNYTTAKKMQVGECAEPVGRTRR